MLPNKKRNFTQFVDKDEIEKIIKESLKRRKLDAPNTDLMQSHLDFLKEHVSILHENIDQLDLQK